MLFEKGNPLVAVRQRGAGGADRRRHPRPAPAAVALRRRWTSPSSSDAAVTDAWAPSARELERRSRAPPPARPARSLIATAVTVVVFAGCARGVVTSPGLAARARARSSTASTRASRFRRDPAGLLDQREAVPDLRAADPGPRRWRSRWPRNARVPWLLPAAAGRGRLHRRLPRHPHDPAGRAARASACRRSACRASRTARSSGRRPRWSSPTAPTSPRCSAPASTRSTPRRWPAPRRWGCAAARRCGSSWCRRPSRRVVPPLLNDFVSLQKDTALVVGGGRLRRGLRGARLRQLQLQLHAARRGGRLLRRADRAAGAVHRLAAAALARARAGGCAVTTGVAAAARGHRRPQVLRRQGGPRRHRPHRRAARRGLPDRVVRARASRRCCAASTCSRRSTTG